MLYLLDANVLITADRLYYPMDRVPQFWDWILEQSSAGNIKIPFEIYGEIVDGKADDLVKWLKANKAVIQLDEEVDVALVQEVIERGYAEDLNDVELDQIAKDPFLVAYARMKPNRCVVTLENSSPRKQRANRKIPDVCSTFGVACCDTFQLIRDLDFKINKHG
jgi:hypothetical protein